VDVRGTLMEALGIETAELGPDRVVCTMPVDHRTRQPFGYLHGGASLALAETAASLGTAANLDAGRELAFGMEINANHLRSVADGRVTAVAVPLHKGRTSMVWDIRITDDRGRLVCVSRCTVAIRPRRQKDAPAGGTD
jgi:uncharacterized protein (TIGR00369 family)